MSELVHDLSGALLHLSRQLERHHLAGGFVLTLQDSEDGNRLMAAADRQHIYALPLVGNWRELEVAGVKVRWPR